MVDLVIGDSFFKNYNFLAFYGVILFYSSRCNGDSPIGVRIVVVTCPSHLLLLSSHIGLWHPSMCSLECACESVWSGYQSLVVGVINL